MVFFLMCVLKKCKQKNVNPTKLIWVCKFGMEVKCMHGHLEIMSAKKLKIDGIKLYITLSQSRVLQIFCYTTDKISSDDISLKRTGLQFLQGLFSLQFLWGS
jgi:hypothetical protein